MVDGHVVAEPHGAAAVLHLVAHRLSRRDGRLIGVGVDGDFRCHPVAVGPKEVALAAALVFEGLGAQIGRQSVLAALRAIGEEHVAGHADARGDLVVVEEGAIVDDAGERRSVREPLFFEGRGEAESDLVAGRHGLRQLVDAVMEAGPLLVDHRSFQLQAVHAGALLPADVDGRDGLLRAVLQHESASRHGPHLLREQRHVQRDGGDARLREALEGEELLLHVRDPRLPLRGGDIGVANIGVEEDEGPAADEDGEPGGEESERLAADPLPDLPEARPERDCRPAAPQRVREHGEHEREGPPVHLKPRLPHPETAHPVHVGERDCGSPGVVVEVVLQTGGAHHERRDDVEQHHAPAQELLRNEHLHEDGERGEEHGVHRRRPDEPQEIGLQLDGRAAPERLRDDACEHRDERGAREDQRDGHDLGHQEHPVRRARGVDNLVDFAIAIAPDELSRIIDGDEDGHEGEGAREGLHHQASDRVRRGAVAVARVPERADGVHDADAEEHEERRAPEHEGHVEARDGPPPQPPDSGGGGSSGAGGRGLFRGGRACRGGAARARLEAKHLVGEREEDPRDARPQHAIGQQEARDLGEARVALGGSPVLGGDREGGEAEGIAQGREGVVPRIAREAARHDVEDQRRHGADVRPHHRAGGGGKREEGRRQDEQRREAEDEQRIHVVVQVERPHLLVVEPRHGRADEHRQRHRRKDEESRRHSAEEAPAQIGTLGDRGRPEDGGKPCLVVADHHVGHHRDDDEEREKAHDRLRLEDREGGVHVDVAATADLDLIDRHRAEGQEEEDGAPDPEDGAPRLVAPLEGEDLCEHGGSLHEAAAAGRRCSWRVEK